MPEKRFPVRALATGTALAALLPFACGGKKGAGGFTPPPTNVEVVAAEQGPVRETLHALGTIEAAERIRVATEIDAAVQSLPFDEGRLVAAGQPIAILNDAELKAEANRAAALRDQAKVNAARFEKLAQVNVASSQERDNSEATLQVAEANLKLAEARLSKTRIFAPFAGVVGRRLVSPGAFLRAGDVIAELARVDNVKVGFSVPERFLADLKRGARVRATTVAYPDRTFTGTVEVVDPIVDPTTRSARLNAMIPNPRGELRPGMSADVTAILAERLEAITVPDEAVFTEGDKSYLYVVKPDSTVTRRAVRLGVRQPGRVEVVEGLQKGDRVVRAGHQKLFEGAKVAPIETKKAA